MTYNINVSGLTYMILKSECEGEIYKPDTFIKKQLRQAEKMNFQVRRIKLNFKFKIELNFKIKNSGVGIGILLHETHLRQMRAYVDGYRQHKSKRSGVISFFEKYNINNEYDYESAYRYIKSKKKHKNKDLTEKNTAVLIPRITELLTPVSILSKIEKKYNLQPKFYEKLTRSKQDYHISCICYYLLYTYSQLNQTDISNLFKKSKSSVNEALNKFMKKLYTDNAKENEVLKILS